MLQKASRDFDVVCRYGGEEFAVILPGCGAPEAFEVAERLRAAVAREEVSQELTVSVGAATFPRCAPTASGLVAAAEGAVFQAKRRGRDRTSVSSRRASAAS